MICSSVNRLPFMWVLLGVDGGHLPSKYSGPKNRGHLILIVRNLFASIATA
jgi:hypothetical protein